MFKFFINNIEITDQPIGWKEFEVNIRFEKDTRLMLVNAPLSLKFWGHGWEVLRGLRNTSICDSVEFKIEQRCNSAYESIFSGTIFITDIDWDRQKCIAETSITDNSLSATIKNNWNIEVGFFGGYSKTGDVIGNAPAFSLDLFNPQNVSATVQYESVDNTWIAHNGQRRAFDLKDALNYMVRFMSNDELTLESDWYDNLPDDAKYSLVRGYELRLGAAVPSDDPLSIPEISFFDIWEAISRWHNLFIYVDGTVVRIEEIGDRENADVIFQLNNVKDVVENIKQDILYSTVKLGNREYPEVTPDTIQKQTRFFTFNIETYHLLNDCNIDNELDLSSTKIISDTNAIEDVIVNDNQDYDGNVFIVQYNSATDQATANNIFSGEDIGPFQYNPELINERVANRYTLLGGIVKYFGTDTTFHATGQVSGIIPSDNTDDFSLPSALVHEISPFPFPNEIHDPSLNYNDGLYRYTAPETGVYSIYINFFIIWKGMVVPSVNPNFRENFVVDIQQYNSSDVLLDTKRIASYEGDAFTGNGAINYSESSRINTEIQRQGAFDESGLIVSDPFIETQKKTRIFLFEKTFNMFMNDTEYIQVAFKINWNDLGGINLDSEYEILGVLQGTGTATSGGIFVQDDNASKYNMINFSFNQEIPNDKARNLISNPISSIDCGDVLGRFVGIPENISVRLSTGETTWELTSRDNLLTL